MHINSLFPHLYSHVLVCSLSLLILHTLTAMLNFFHFLDYVLSAFMESSLVLCPPPGTLSLTHQTLLELFSMFPKPCLSFRFHFRLFFLPGSLPRHLSWVLLCSHTTLSLSFLLILLDNKASSVEPMVYLVYSYILRVKSAWHTCDGHYVFIEWICMVFAYIAHCKLL